MIIFICVYLHLFHNMRESSGKNQFLALSDQRSKLQRYSVYCHGGRKIFTFSGASDFFVILLMKKLLINFLPVSYSFSSTSLLIMEQTEPVYSFEVRKTL